MERWFSENFSEIEKNRAANPFLARNTLLVEHGQRIKLSEFLRKVSELGYSKVWEAENRGEFSQRGGVVRIFPINSDKIFAIEFEGNFIANILQPQSLADEISRRGRAPRAERVVGLRKFQAQGIGLVLGDYVVHIDHGIGVYRGLAQNTTQTGADIVIEYAPPRDRPNSPDLLFVPKKEIRRIQPYLGFKKPEIHRLGTPLWALTKKRAKEDIVAYARELLKTLAERKAAHRAPYGEYVELEEEFAADFAHEYTPGQKKALEEIFSDMARPEPMERILAGDVGFGKTEIALAAALRAALNGRQTAILAPTTVLADQHFEVFRARLEKYGVETARLTRLESQARVGEIVGKIKSGGVDVVIGTHKLLGKGIEFKNLGLLVIDEEQKFGVLQKEKFKKQNPALDILALSATPIPRTLHLSLSGLRQISSIETPPEGRMEIKTFVLPKNKKIMKGAIEFELARGGQIYFLANRIHKIPRLFEEIKSLSAGWRTGLKIGILHGRMPEEKIIQTMRDFRDGKSHLLVSTTIIENGLDLSNVNTLIVEDSTKLGLAQAHQLRGRIGRGEREAFAYFLYPTQKLREKAAGRLEALERYSWLGAGLELAKKDLEIRGAGNILGKAQSGIAFRVGLNLYFELLGEAIEELKKIDNNS